MNHIMIATIDRIENELSQLLNRCSTYDVISTHFSQYLLREMIQGNIEDYNFVPNLTPSEVSVRVDLYFYTDSMTISNVLIIKKKDTPAAAYNRAMGVV